MVTKKIDVAEILGCVEAINDAVELINATPNNPKLLRIYRGSALKEFEIVLEQTGRLLRQALSYQTEKSTKSLSYKDVFRQAVTSMLISPEEAERWFEYRDLRNESAHEYGQDMANQLIEVMDKFVVDARKLLTAIGERDYD